MGVGIGGIAGVVEARKGAGEDGSGIWCWGHLVAGLRGARGMNRCRTAREDGGVGEENVDDDGGGRNRWTARDSRHVGIGGG